MIEKSEIILHERHDSGGVFLFLSLGHSGPDLGP